MATIKDIAEKLNISPGTVSKGLNGGRDISEALRRRVLDTAVEVGYTSRRTEMRDTRSFAVFVENMSHSAADQFGYEIVLGFRQAAFKTNWHVDVIDLSPELQASVSYGAYMTAHGYSGAYLLGLSLADAWMEQFRDTRFPTILLDNFIPGNPNVVSLGTDSEAAMEASVSHLISLGHEKIAFLGGSAHSFISDQRMLAYLQTLRKYRLPIDPNLAIYGYYVSDAARYHMPGLIALGATAILCGNDDIARGVLDYCAANGLRVPEDVSVIGFDDMPFAAALNPPLSTIRQDRQALGKCGVYLMQSLLDGSAVSRQMLHPQLVLRASTAPARPRLVTSRAEDKDSVLLVNPQLYAQYNF